MVVWPDELAALLGEGRLLYDAGQALERGLALSAFGRIILSRCSNQFTIAWGDMIKAANAADITAHRAIGICAILGVDIL